MKRLLKKLFPIVLLKKAFLIYNKIKIKTLDKVIFPEYHLQPEEFFLKRDVALYDLLNIREEKLSASVRSRLQLWHGWTQDEYLLSLETSCCIEPKQGWAFSKGKLVYPSLGFSRAEYIHKPDFWKWRFSQKKMIILERAISLRDTGEENYFHFYNDVLAKLCFFEEKVDLSFSIPIIISDKLYQKPYFQYFLKNSSLLSGRQWVVQNDEYIEVQHCYFCKPLTHTKAYLDKIAASVKKVPYEPNFSDKVFLTRHPKRLRYIANMAEVENMCARLGIRVIDTDTLTLEEQIALFSNTSLLIGIHGAGLVNMIYGAESIQKIIEIFPPSSYIPFHYIMLAHLYGFEYDAVLGETYDKLGGFTVDLKSLEEKLLSVGQSTISTSIAIG